MKRKRSDFIQQSPLGENSLEKNNVIQQKRLRENIEEKELEANLFIEETMKNELEEKEAFYLEEMYYLEEKYFENIIEDHQEQLAYEKEYQEQLKQDEVNDEKNAHFLFEHHDQVKAWLDVNDIVALRQKALNKIAEQRNAVFAQIEELDTKMKELDTKMKQLKDGKLDEWLLWKKRSDEWSKENQG